jgi:hypothetical protein
MAMAFRAEAKRGAETYNELLKNPRDNLKILADKIAPKVYQYGFLKE